MTEAAETAKNPDAAPNTETEGQASEKEAERSFQFWVLVSIGGSIGLCLLLFAAAMLVGTFSGRWENIAALISIIRDLMIIFLILEAILIGVAIIVMLIQLSALINLLQNEINPIVENTKQATQTVKGTAQFISTRVTKPVMKTYASLAGLRVFVKEIRAIRRNTRPPAKEVKKDKQPALAKGDDHEQENK